MQRTDAIQHMVEFLLQHQIQVVHVERTWSMFDELCPKDIRTKQERALKTTPRKKKPTLAAHFKR